MKDLNGEMEYFLRYSGEFSKWNKIPGNVHARMILEFGTFMYDIDKVLTSRE